MKVSRKVHVLSCIAPYINIAKSDYWWFVIYIPVPLLSFDLDVSESFLNKKTNRLHEKYLYSHNRSSFEYLLDKDKNVWIHVKMFRYSL